MVVGAEATDVGTVVIGSGPGGYVAAIRAAELGQAVTIIERDDIGGVCLNVGCIPSKALIKVGHQMRELQHGNLFGMTVTGALDWPAVQSWKQTQVVEQLTSGVAMLLKKHKVQIIKGEATFTDNETLNVMQEDGHELLRFENAIIATGSRPVEIPSLKFGGRIIDSTGLLNLPEVPQRLIVVGGGVIGSELGGAFANLGAQVTIVEGLDHTLNGFDAEMTKPVLADFTQHGGEIITSARAKGAVQTDEDVTLTYEIDGTEHTVTGDYLLVSVGRRANTDTLGLNNTDIKVGERGLITVDDQMKTSVAHIYAIGDVVAGPALAHKASFEGKIAAAAISGADHAHDLHYSLPSVAYTQYELATAGETPDSVKEKGLKAKISKFPFAANGRALSMDAAVGFVRLITDKDTQAILGAQIVGPSASDLISELSLAIENGLTSEDISLTIHPHPTLSEAIMDAAEVADGLGIHI